MVSYPRLFCSMEQPMIFFFHQLREVDVVAIAMGWDWIMDEYGNLFVPVFKSDLGDDFHI